MIKTRSQSFSTKLGRYYLGKTEDIIQNKLLRYYRNKINLILTSPPFPLNKKKKYGNLQGEKYKNWLASFAPVFSELLTDDGSIVIELGNAWDDGAPVQSLLPLESLMAFLNSNGNKLNLCQEFICYNPARLPSPAQWVTINRIRTVDSFTRVWWISKSKFPKADNSKVLRPYSDSMKHLLKMKKYNSGLRPSEHKISEKGFYKRNKGSIPHNLIELEPIDDKRDPRLPKNVLSFSNTSSNDYYLSKCRELKIKPHPARMPSGLASFFIQFLTDKNDLVFDPFGGSNTTGFVAESLNRRWITTEISKDYIKQAIIKMKDPKLNSKIKVVRK